MADGEQVESLIEEGQTARRGRRAQAEQAVRRRRRTDDSADTSALAVSDEIKRELAAKGLEGRWINDIGNRMYQKTELDDWDKVPGVEPVPVGTDNRTGGRIMAHFCAKPKEFLAEDNRRRIDRINAREQATFSGKDHGEMNEGAYNPLEQSYVGRRAPS